MGAAAQSGVVSTEEVTSVLSPNLTLPEEFRPLRVEEYHQLIELGVFEGTKIELVGGVLVEMSPQGPAHFGLIPFLTHLLVRLVGEDYVVSSGTLTAVAVPPITIDVGELLDF